MPSLCLATAQSISTPGRLAANIERHCRFVERAASATLQRLLPELSLSGYEPGLAAGRVIEPADESQVPLRALARYYGMMLVSGAPLWHKTNFAQ